MEHSARYLCTAGPGRLKLRHSGIRIKRGATGTATITRTGPQAESKHHLQNTYYPRSRHVSYISHLSTPLNPWPPRFPAAIRDLHAVLELDSHRDVRQAIAGNRTSTQIERRKKSGPMRQRQREYDPLFNRPNVVREANLLQGGEPVERERVEEGIDGARMFFLAAPCTCTSVNDHTAAAKLSTHLYRGFP